MIRRLVNAARPKPSAQLEKNRDTIRFLASRYGMGSPKVFGSVARGTDTTDSDLDLLVDPERGQGLFALSRFARAVEEALGVKVDVVSVGGLRTQHGAIHRDAVPV